MNVQQITSRLATIGTMYAGATGREAVSPPMLSINQTGRSIASLYGRDAHDRIEVMRDTPDAALTGLMAVVLGLAPREVAA